MVLIRRPSTSNIFSCDLKIFLRGSEKIRCSLLQNIINSIHHAPLEDHKFLLCHIDHNKSKRRGGDIVLLYASKYHDVNAVINLSGRYDLKAGIEERLGKDYLERIRNVGFIDVKKKRSGSFDFRVTEESLMDRLGTNMHEACLHIDKECRVLTTHGSSDKIIPVQDAHEFAKIIPNHRLHIIEGADHAFSNHQDELSSVVVSFIEEIMHQNTNRVFN
ncbi:uncharacterized protein LOC130726648 isoform X2 [Lotus japonicus]|uniref:uncharacterized protein LOC130726648 isoform X2 n=1 Tax=Lotus japonicus TaxID=34305 RepID=UPI0025835A90|nr:uncharacterized protein LOC130726648 isoform X2 [Lotus japonicus]